MQEKARVGAKEVTLKGKLVIDGRELSFTDFYDDEHRMKLSDLESILGASVQFLAYDSVIVSIISPKPAPDPNKGKTS
jgi:hypothetical protein